ncbi:MAG: glycosyltransferase [Microbacterium sp.]|uniref:glycosyltransferase n=1 Tax=Microbacterium sp. TaxID=51671 RepID=UPI002723139F|nr:glycosyltransferase [Microbacterium sp.]MDO8383192.1 glycosyltransferase [Microbacterium sp.]
MADIVFLSHTARSSYFRVGSHHLSQALAQQSHRVAHISTPFSWIHHVVRPEQRARRAAAKEGVTNAGGVADLVPRPLLPVNVRWSKYQMQAALAKVGIPAPAFVFIDQPLFPVGSLTGATVIFRPTDVFTSKSVQAAALATARRADGVAATSPGVLASLGLDASIPETIIENGVDFSRFSQAAAATKEYDFVYVGALDIRFDFETVRLAAERLPDRSFVLYGPPPSPLPFMPPNVQFRGAISYERVPEAMARGRFGVMPFVPGHSNDGRSPMKLYEYVAAGLPVIAPRQLVDRSPRLSCLRAFDPHDREAFADALSDEFVPSPPSRLDTNIARSMDWSAVATELFGFAQRVAAR